MSTSIVLELTKREAESLRTILVRGILWSLSGDAGRDAQNISYALDDAGVSVGKARPANGALQTWSIPE